MQIFPPTEKNKINQEELVYSSDANEISNLSDFKEILVDSENENVYVSAK